MARVLWVTANLKEAICGEDYEVLEMYPTFAKEAEEEGNTKAANSFRRADAGEGPFKGILLTDSSFKVSAAILDHQIPCLAYSLEEEYHINIDKAKLNKLNLRTHGATRAHCSSSAAH